MNDDNINEDEKVEEAQDVEEVKAASAEASTSAEASVDKAGESKDEKGSKKSSSGKKNEPARNASQSDAVGEVEKLKEKIADLEDQLLRSIADYRNQEMRFEEEKREFVKFANRDLLLRLIPAFDTLFLAEKYVADEGIKLTIKHLKESLREVGVEQVATEGKEYDAQLMEAVTTGEGEEGKVLEELRPGYMLNGKLVRPAQVKVGKSV